MASFRVRVYRNRDVLWVELMGAATATPAPQVKKEVAAAFAYGARPSDGEAEAAGEAGEIGDAGDAPRGRYVLDLSQVLTVGGHTLEAILDAVPRVGEVALIPPPESGWFEGVRRRIDLSVTVYASERHALLALGLESRGTLIERPDENRRHVRVETNLRSKIWFNHPQGARFGRTIITNLSKSGAYLTKLDVPLGPDEFRYFASGMGPLMIDLPISLDAKRHVRSRVVRVDTRGGLPQLGVKFEELDPSLERALASYIAARVPEALARAREAKEREPTAADPSAGGGESGGAPGPLGPSSSARVKILRAMAG